jgi:hypothetical protein
VPDAGASGDDAGHEENSDVSMRRKTRRGRAFSFKRDGSGDPRK